MVDSDGQQWLLTMVLNDVHTCVTVDVMTMVSFHPGEKPWFMFSWLTMGIDSRLMAVDVINVLTIISAGQSATVF